MIPASDSCDAAAGLAVSSCEIAALSMASTFSACASPNAPGGTNDVSGLSCGAAMAAFCTSVSRVGSNAS